MSQAQSAVEAARKPQPVRVTVDYLPAAEPYRHAYSLTTVLESIRVAAMEFFGVQDRQERDTYRYYLEFEGERLTDTTRTLGEVIGERHKRAHFNLIEEITPGAH